MAPTPSPPATSPAGGAVLREARPAVLALAVAVAASAAVLALPAVRPGEALPALMVPWLIVLAGAIAPRVRASRFVTLLLVAIGAGQLAALALSSAAIVLAPAPAGALLHTSSQLVFAATFALLVPLAAGYPGPAAPAWSGLAAIPLALPLAAGLAGPSPAVLGGRPLPPIATLLPPQVAEWAGLVFALPLAAVLIGAIRWLRGDRDLRARLAWPLAALGALAAVIALGAVTPEESRNVTDALFLVTAPLVPIGLVAGARHRDRPDAERIRRDLAAIVARVDALGSSLQAGPSAAVAAPSSASQPPPHRAAGADGLASLTPRERAVLERIALGRSNPAIASELHLSVSAVEKHTSAIFAKLGIPPSPDVHRRVAAASAWHRASRG